MAHQGITTLDDGRLILPCIVLEESRFNHIMDKIAGLPISVDTNLNVIHDGQRNVFVAISLEFSRGKIREELLVEARKHLKFFELMAEHSVIAMSSSNPQESRVFMIQLPRKERAQDALDIIYGAL